MPRMEVTDVGLVPAMSAHLLGQPPSITLSLLVVVVVVVGVVVVLVVLVVVLRSAAARQAGRKAASGRARR